MEQRGKLLVTGAAGFIGAEVARYAASQGYQVLAIDALLDGLYPADEKRARFSALASHGGITTIQADLRHLDWTEIDSDIEYVINLAAMPGLRLSWSEFELYRSCNLDVVARLVDASSQWPLTKFIQISTSSVYGKNAVGDENSPLDPVSPYGVTKLAAENLVLAHHRVFGLPVSILRYFSVFGPGQRPDMAYRKIIDKALAGEPVTILGDGSQSRTNTFVSDVAKTTVDALERAGAGEVYNICGDEEHTLRSAVDFILEEANSSSPLKFGDRVPGDQDRTAGNNAKSKEKLGFVSSTTLHEGLREQIASLRRQ